MESLTAGIDVKEGATPISILSVVILLAIEPASSLASAIVLFIFQLPNMIGVLVTHSPLDMNHISYNFEYVKTLQAVCYLSAVCLSVELSCWDWVAKEYGG